MTNKLGVVIMNELKKHINDVDIEDIRIFEEDIISVKRKKENPHQIV